MQIGMIGLGRMGGNMAERLARGGHSVTAYDRDAAAVRGAEGRGVGLTGATTFEALIARLTAPRAVWLMVPSGAATEETIASVARHLTRGDIIIDGGNSRYTDTMRRGLQLAERGVELVDVGTSGGIWGLNE